LLNSKDKKIANLSFIDKQVLENILEKKSGDMLDFSNRVS